MGRGRNASSRDQEEWLQKQEENKRVIVEAKSGKRV